MSLRLHSLPLGFVLLANLSLLLGATDEPTFTVLKDEVSQTPGKTQVSQDLLVKPDIKEAELRAILAKRFSEASQRTGFRYHKHPTLVAIYAYPSREHAESGMGQWIGMLLKGPLDKSPQISMGRSLGKSWPEDVRFGFTETRRREIYKKLVTTEDEAGLEADRQHPTDFRAQTALSRKLLAEKRDALARELNITPEQLREITKEGFEKNWPMPKGEKRGRQ